MPQYLRANAKGGTFFFTVVTHKRRKIFLQAEKRELLRNIVSKVRKELFFSIDAWALLPDHLHCLWTLPEGDGDFSKRWALIKLRFAKEVRNIFDTNTSLETNSSNQCYDDKIGQNVSGNT